MSRAREEMMRRLYTGIDAAKQVLVVFAGELTRESPSHALEWGNGAFEAAARVYVFRELVGNFEGGCGAPEMLAHCTSVAMQMTRSPKSSSSATSNLMSQHIAAQWASCAQMLEQLIRNEPKEQA